MMLFHCHQPLTDTSFSNLLELIESVEEMVIILFRENGVDNLNHKDRINSLKEFAILKVLTIDLKSNPSTNKQNNFIESIDYMEFVQLCIDSEKIISWK